MSLSFPKRKEHSSSHCGVRLRQQEAGWACQLKSRALPTLLPAAALGASCLLPTPTCLVRAVKGPFTKPVTGSSWQPAHRRQIAALITLEKNPKPI